MAHNQVQPLSTMGLARNLAPQLSSIAVVFLVTGATLATLSLFVSRDLGFGAFAIGIISGAQFMTAVASRIIAGRHSDQVGPKQTVVIGLFMAAIAGVICFAAYLLREWPLISASTLLVGRALLGGGESFLLAGAQTWSMRIAGPARTAMVIGWVGTALFVSLALGAPLGGVLFEIGGFGAVAVFTAVTPALILLLVVRLQAPAASVGAAIKIITVIARVRVQVLAMALACVGYGAMVSFSVLLFVERSWTPSWIGLTIFSVALIAARFTIGSLPDRIGGNKSAMLSLVMQVIGFFLIAFATDIYVAYLGVWLAGFGYSVVYPALAREAVGRVGEQHRGAALAIFSTSIDLTLAIGSPLLGLIGVVYGMGYVFLCAALAGAFSCAVIAGFQYRDAR